MMDYVLLSRRYGRRGRNKMAAEGYPVVWYGSDQALFVFRLWKLAVLVVALIYPTVKNAHVQKIPFRKSEGLDMSFTVWRVRSHRKCLCCFDPRWKWPVCVILLTDIIVGGFNYNWRSISCDELVCAPFKSKWSVSYFLKLFFLILVENQKWLISFF